MEKKKKDTQGSQKMKQYLEDLKRNKYFRKEINKYLKFHKKESKNYPRKTDIVDFLFDEYTKFGKIAKRALRKYEKNSGFNVEKKLARKYAIDSRLLSYITWPMLGLSVIDPNAEIDMCNFVDNYDDNFGIGHGFSQVFPLIMRPFSENHYEAYPVGINIHRFASKRDVLDYIEKKWSLIESCISIYSEKKARFRKRKHSRKLLDFLWENKTLEINKLKNKLDRTFPGNGLVYYEIYKIISLERQRRMKELTVGQ